MRSFDYSTLKEKNGIMKLFHLLLKFMNIKEDKKYILNKNQKN